MPEYMKKLKLEEETGRLTREYNFRVVGLEKHERLGVEFKNER